MPQKDGVTLRDIAERLRLSRMTVSMALRDVPGVAAETRERVRRTAQEMGYRPDPVVSRAMESIRLSAHQRNPTIVGFITHGPDGEWRSVPTVSQYADGIRSRAQELGMEVQVFGRGEQGMSDRRLSNILQARGIERLIVAPLPRTRVGERIDFDWERFTAITLGQSLSWPPMHRCCANHFEAAVLAYHEVARRGYRRIGLAVSRDEDQRAGGRWHGGFLKAEVDHRREPVPVFMPRDWTQMGLRDWLHAVKPDAVIGQSSLCLEWIRAEGFNVPEDFAFACVSRRPALRAQSVAGIRQRFEGIGGAAVSLLASSMIGNDHRPPAHPTTVEITGEWVDGITVPERRPNRAGSVAVA